MSFLSFARQAYAVRHTLGLSHVGLQKPSQIFLQARHRLHSLPRSPVVKAGRSLPLFCKAAGIAGVGLGLSALSGPAIQCEAPVRSAPPPPTADATLPPNTSIVNFYELSFGTVCGICAGVFIKKGAKTLAFLFGGVFVLLQYLGSFSVVRVDWVKVGQRFENMFYTTEVNGTKKAPSVVSLWNWLVNFLVADFQPRASFIAGLALGLRIG